MIKNLKIENPSREIDILIELSKLHSGFDLIKSIEYIDEALLIANKTENKILHGHKKGSKNNKKPILVLGDRG